MSRRNQLLMLTFVGWWRRRARLTAMLWVALCALSQTSCQSMQEISKIYLSATPEGRDLLERWKHYESIAGQLEHYTDDGQLDPSEVLDVLVGAGVIKPLPPPGRGGTRPPSQPPPPPGGRWAWPMKAGVISSEYGQRATRPHEGIDIAANVGEPVYAASSGSVIYSGNGMRGYGNALILRHDDQTTTLYAHATTLIVRKGAAVSRGTRIATVGSTGRSSGPHLHFEVRVGEAAIDPRKILPRQPF